MPAVGAAVNVPGAGAAAPKAPERTLDIKVRPQPTPKEREAAQIKAHDRLLGIVMKHKDVDGNGQEASAEGDPRINERRSAITTLLALKRDDAFYLSFLEKIGPNVEADLKWLRAAEYKDYSVDSDDQFGWSQSTMVKPKDLEQEFKKRVAEGLKRANDFLRGRSKYFDVSDNSLVGLRFLADRGDRAMAIADAVWQLRARTDMTKRQGWGDNRIDQIGPALTAEMRVVLGTADFTQLEGRREYALLSQAIASHPVSSVNSIFEARNAVAQISRDSAKHYLDDNAPTAWIHKETPPGASDSPYKSIHHNFSRDTAKNITAFVREWMLPIGAVEERPRAFVRLVSAMLAARRGDADGARADLLDLKESTSGDIQVEVGKLLAAPGDLADAIRDFLKAKCQKNLGENVEKNLDMAARLYNAVCGSQPTAESIAAQLFRAGEAMPELCDVLVAMSLNDDVALLNELGEARRAIVDAVKKSNRGYLRHELIVLDAQLNRLTCEELGAAVDAVGDMKQDQQLVFGLVAVRAGLRAVQAAGLECLTGDDNLRAAGNELERLVDRLDSSFRRGKIDMPTYRKLMADVRRQCAKTVQQIRAFFDTRAAAVASNGIALDPEFIDQFIKQTPLHYVTALSEKGMRAGLVEEIGERKISNVEGMRVLNSIGPVVFKSVVFAENTRDLAKLKAPRDALSVLYELREKKMVAVGGLMVDTQHAPGGNSHLNMYAMNNGIPVIALPELRNKYAAFFKKAAEEGGIYVDDADGQFHMMTVGLAKEQGLIKDDDVQRLRPGANRKITYLKPTPLGDAFETLAKHDAVIAPGRPTREVVLYVPQPEVRGVGKQSTSFTDLGKLGIHGRHLAGEKGLVLALMKANPELAAYVPDGSVVTTGRIQGLLEAAGLSQAWEDVWGKDPKVGVVDDKNFLQSAFYTDPDYREAKRAELQASTRDKLLQHLVEKNDKGEEKLTAAGEALYAELAQNPALAQSDTWIARSSFTGEDRPGKSGAGQYESFPHLKDAVSRIKGVVGVIESAWMTEPVDNNVADQVFLKHIMPSVVMQHCLKPDLSGVVITRNTEHGTRNQITYQLVKGFGGGVDGGKAEEGLVTSTGPMVRVKYPGEDKGLTDPAALTELRTICLKVEKFFDEVVEKGQGHAVDMEVARIDGKWMIVQARVILLDK